MEQNLRKSKQSDADREAVEKKYEEMVKKYEAVKHELDATIKGIEDL